MILTGPRIRSAVEEGEIHIEPFTPANINPNSYNFTLGSTLKVYDDDVLDSAAENTSSEIKIPADGILLEPGQLYLAHTIERMGSDNFAPTFAARSSVARLGLFINLSAPLGDIGYFGQWTLQLYCIQPVRVYTGMRIGQMMFWQPSGPIELYDGKYQGSSGPRSSDIHKDVRKRTSKLTLPTLDAEVDKAAVGGKFYELSRLSPRFPVPQAFVIPCDFVLEAITPEHAAATSAVVQDLRATVGSNLQETNERLSAIGARFTFRKAQVEMIRSAIKDLLESTPGASLAVRSSALDEDTEFSSSAGVYASLLNVQPADAIAAAEQVVGSWYAPPAIAARLRRGDFAEHPQLAVIVQVMAPAQTAGAAFTSRNDQVTISYVEGIGEGLVAGTSEAVTYSASLSGIENDTGHSPALLRMIRDLRSVYDFEIDVEWAETDDGVSLLQCRPLTQDLRSQEDSPEPYFRTARLYDSAPAGFGLGEVATVVAGYEAKRSRPYALAREAGLLTGNGNIVAYNSMGLARCSAFVREVAPSGTPKVVIDLSPSIRQIVVELEALRGTLDSSLTGLPKSVIRQAVVREFIEGDAGVLASRNATGSIRLDVSRDGLIGINRGTAEASVYEIRGHQLVRPAEDSLAEVADVIERHQDAIRKLFEALDPLGVQSIELVVFNSAIYFTDFTRSSPTDSVVSVGGQVLSEGLASGPVLDLTDETELLSKLSLGPAVSVESATEIIGHDGFDALARRIDAFEERPIVVASRPYAVLSVFLDRVSGFVFRGGSALSHLGILLREARIPGVLSNIDVSDGDRITIADGSVVSDS